MKLGSKVEDGFKISLDKMSLEQLQKMLEEYQEQIIKLKKGPIKELIDNYSEYLSVDESIREQHSQLQKQYRIAVDTYQYLSSRDDTLYELSQLGECDYYFIGTPQEIKQAEEQMNSLQVRLLSLEQLYPKLMIKKTESRVIPMTLISVYSNIVKRIHLINEAINKKHTRK